jgi:energy-coupling factor transporter ATP-binding protein EcfA2
VERLQRNRKSGTPFDDLVTCVGAHPLTVDDRAQPQAAVPAASLRELVDRLEGLAARRWALGGPPADAARTRAARLRDHLAGHVRIRARSLDAPLVVLLLGPTGAGKSTLFNTIAGRAASPTGVLRPTTRTAIVLANPDDATALREGTLAGIEPKRLHYETDPSLDAGLALVDAPDIDSVEHANRELADQLVEAADLCLFVTTATRYADRVPWLVLGRVRERGLPLIVVVNRLPSEADDRRVVLDDVERLFTEAGLAGQASEGLGADGSPRPLEVVGVTEGQIEPAREALVETAVEAVTGRITHLRSDRDARVELAARALAGSLAGLGPLVDQIADDAAHEAIDAAADRRIAATYHERALGAVREAVSRGTFLREEALRHWQDYVGADDITRIFSKGIGAVRGAIASIFRPSRAPVAEIREATTDDLIAVARLHAAEAARRTASAWSEDRSVADAVAADPSLWGPSAGFDDRLRVRLEDWIASIGTDIAETGEGKRRLAKGASIGVNAVGVGVMLATFIHTAGLTGTEVGVAAATAFVNQKLLGALFGEAAMVELIARARRRLDDALVETFADEQARFDALAPSPDDLEALAADLHDAAAELRALPAVVPMDAVPLFGRSDGDGPEPAGRGSAAAGGLDDDAPASR